MSRELLALYRMLQHFESVCKSYGGIPDNAWNDYWAARELTGWPGIYDPEATARGLASLDAEICLKPPAGWSCSREPGHGGPCAARPDGGYRKTTVLRRAVDTLDSYIWAESDDGSTELDRSLVPEAAVAAINDGIVGSLTITVEFTPDAEKEDGK